jgi:hypothetical protein
VTTLSTVPADTAVSLIAPLLGVLLGWTGIAKLRTGPAAASGTALARLLGNPLRTAHALRAVGAAELLLAAALLTAAAAPVAPPAGWATAALGAAFLAYLGYARRSAPDASCGCSGNSTAPAGPRTFARAGAVLAGGLAMATVSTEAWWTVLTRHPAASAVLLTLGAALLAWLSATPERRWVVAARRVRLRLLGHPLTGRGGVPVAASVELVERSLAWETVAPVIRTGLLEHWDEDGWRILHYAGSHDAGDGPQPATVLFAVDATAHWDLPGEPIVRVTVLHRDTGEPFPVDPPPQRRTFPLAG